MPYTIPPKPALFQGQKTDSTTEALLCADLQQRGITGIQVHPTRFVSPKGIWSPDASCHLLTSEGLRQVFWDFKYQGWFRDRDYGDLPVRMLSAYDSYPDSWAVIAELGPDPLLRLVLPGGRLRRLTWSPHANGKWELVRVHRPSDDHT